VANDKTRCDYQAADMIVKSFKSESETVQKMTQDLGRLVQGLQGGQWVGKAATAFYNEMDGIVFPSLKRLHAALAEASKGMSEIAKEVKQTEETTQNLLNGSKLF
jgi:WXG100 family type VII secretion target